MKRDSSLQTNICSVEQVERLVKDHIDNEIM